MTPDIKIDRLEQLREGNSFQYRGVTWVVRDCKSYKSLKGDRTTEWLIESNSGRKYYLLQEVSARDIEQNIDGSVDWYLAEKLKNAIIAIPDFGKIRPIDIWSAMQNDREPYPQLEASLKTFIFDSKSVEICQEDGSEETRITWDYWDCDRHWNLGLEAWQTEGDIDFYLTQKVQPQEFGYFKQSFFDNSSNTWQTRVAAIFLGIGILLMIFG